jgi:cytochrome c oxidase subunit 1
VHDTHFVVAHFHYIVFGGTGYAFMAALHYWFPKMFGRMYDLGWANLGWGIFFIGFNALYLPMFFLGMQGMPRRYYDYLPDFHGGNIISSLGAWVMISGIIIIFANLIRSARHGKKTTQKNPWGGKTLEWQVETPPTLENFEEIPTIEKGPYHFGE